MFLYQKEKRSLCQKVVRAFLLMEKLWSKKVAINKKRSKSNEKKIEQGKKQSKNNEKKGIIQSKSVQL